MSTPDSRYHVAGEHIDSELGFDLVEVESRKRRAFVIARDLVRPDGYIAAEVFDSMARHGAVNCWRVTDDEVYAISSKV